MSVLSRADAKKHLNITVNTQDDELDAFIASAEAAIAKRIGPLVSTPTTTRVIPTGVRLALPVLPAISLTSVTPADGDALALADLHLDTAAGVVTQNNGAAFVARCYDVVYAAGRTVSATENADLYLAIKELVRHLWATQRGPGGRPGSTPSDSASNTIPGAAYLLPFRVSELLAPHMSPGFA